MFAYCRIKINYIYIYIYIYHNQKLLQALDDGLRWVFRKKINDHIYIFKRGSMLIVLLFIFQDDFL